MSGPRAASIGPGLFVAKVWSNVRRAPSDVFKSSLNNEMMISLPTSSDPSEDVDAPMPLVGSDKYL
jgi:hypothetical protein